MVYPGTAGGLKGKSHGVYALFENEHIRLKSEHFTKGTELHKLFVIWILLILAYQLFLIDPSFTKNQTNDQNC